MYKKIKTDLLSDEKILRKDINKSNLAVYKTYPAQMQSVPKMQGSLFVENSLVTHLDNTLK